MLSAKGEVCACLIFTVALQGTFDRLLHSGGRFLQRVRNGTRISSTKDTVWFFNLQSTMISKTKQTTRTVQLKSFALPNDYSARILEKDANKGASVSSLLDEGAEVQLGCRQVCLCWRLALRKSSCVHRQVSTAGWGNDDLDL